MLFKFSLSLVDPVVDQTSDRHRPIGRYDHSRYNSPTILPLRGQS